MFTSLDQGVTEIHAYLFLAPMRRPAICGASTDLSNRLPRIAPSRDALWIAVDPLAAAAPPVSAHRSSACIFGPSRRGRARCAPPCARTPTVVADRAGAVSFDRQKRPVAPCFAFHGPWRPNHIRPTTSGSTTLSSTGPCRTAGCACKTSSTNSPAIPWPSSSAAGSAADKKKVSVKPPAGKAEGCVKALREAQLVVFGGRPEGRCREER